MIYTDKSQLQGKKFPELIKEILKELDSRISTSGYRFSRQKSERNEFEDIAKLFKRTPSPIVPSTGFQYTPLGIDSDDCKLYYNIFDYARDCGVSLPQDFRQMKTIDLLWDLHKILANMRYGVLHLFYSPGHSSHWCVHSYGSSPSQDVFNRFAQSHWLEEYLGHFEGYTIHSYFGVNLPYTNSGQITFFTETSYWRGFLVPYKLSCPVKSRAYFGYGDVQHDVPELTKIDGPSKDVFLSRYPEGHIDVNIPSNDGYESEILFPDYTVQYFECSPVLVYDNASEIVAKGGTVPGYNPQQTS